PSRRAASCARTRCVSSSSRAALRRPPGRRRKRARAMAADDGHAGGGWIIPPRQRAQIFPKPFDANFYADLARRRTEARPRQQTVLDSFDGLAVEIPAGSLLSIELVERAQIVELFPFNLHDPDERLYQQTYSSEGVFLTRGSRLWGTMARYRPLLTIIDDTVASPGSDLAARHHPVLAASSTPLDCRLA